MNDDAPKRIPLDTPAASAAVMLGCYSNQVGPCARACGGLTRRYGNSAQPICPTCQQEKTAAGTARQKG